MAVAEKIEMLSKKYSLSKDDFLKLGSSLALKEKKRELQIERLEFLARYAKADEKHNKSRKMRGEI